MKRNKNAKQVRGAKALDASSSAQSIVRQESGSPAVGSQEVRQGGQGEVPPLPVRRRRGRPPTFTGAPEPQATELVNWLSEGKPLRAWCREPGNPSHMAIYDWIVWDENFALRIAQAREDGYDVHADECIRLADTKPADQVEVGWRRLQIDTRLKLLAKWNPKKYGDRVGVDHAGGVTLNVTTGVPAE
jgi:hypothetical protein